MLLFDQFFWDTNIITLMISVLYEFKYRITIDSVSVRKIKNIWLVTIEFKKEYCLTLVGIHAFKENNYVSWFFKRAKEKMLDNSREIIKIFILLQNVRFQPRTTQRSL